MVNAFLLCNFRQKFYQSDPLQGNLSDLYTNKSCGVKTKLTSFIGFKLFPFLHLFLKGATRFIIVYWKRGIQMSSPYITYRFLFFRTAGEILKGTLGRLRIGKGKLKSSWAGGFSQLVKESQMEVMAPSLTVDDDTSFGNSSNAFSAVGTKHSLCFLSSSMVFFDPLSSSRLPSGGRERRVCSKARF